MALLPRLPMLRVDSDFARILGAHTLEALEAESGSVIGVWANGRIGLVNSAWQRFAFDNDGAAVLEDFPLGSRLLSGISGVLAEYYASAFARVLASSEPWEQEYDCPSVRSKRRFRLRVLPLAGKGMLLIHSLIVEGARVDAPREPMSLSEYVAPNGMVRQCSNCRRTQRVGRADAWDWVPEFVERPAENVSHGICTTCIHQVYPDL